MSLYWLVFIHGLWRSITRTQKRSTRNLIYRFMLIWNVRLWNLGINAIKFRDMIQTDRHASNQYKPGTNTIAIKFHPFMGMINLQDRTELMRIRKLMIVHKSCTRLWLAKREERLWRLRKLSQFTVHVWTARLHLYFSERFEHIKRKERCD